MWTDFLKQQNTVQEGISFGWWVRMQKKHLPTMTGVNIQSGLQTDGASLNVSSMGWWEEDELLFIYIGQ